jgi:hypothetical protein
LDLKGKAFLECTNRLTSVIEKIDIIRSSYSFHDVIPFGKKCILLTTKISLKSANNSTKLSTDQEMTSEPINISHMTDNTLHNLLYYIYTGKVHLHLDQFCGNCGCLRNSVCPQVKNPFELYRIALKYQFEMLAARCFHYLFSTVTPINIYERLVSLWPHSSLRGEELRVFYLDYLVENFNVVKERDELISVMEKDTKDANKHLKEIMTEVKKRQNPE